MFSIMVLMVMGSPVKPESEQSEYQLVKQDPACVYEEQFCISPTLWCRYRCYDCGSRECPDTFTYRDVACATC